MNRLRLRDLRQSRLPETVGLTRDNIPAIARVVNEAQQRLIWAPEQGEEGWWGTWATLEYSVLGGRECTIVTPREVARVQSVLVNRNPVVIHNPFFEFTMFGTSRLMEGLYAPGRFVSGIEVWPKDHAVIFGQFNGPSRITVSSDNTADTGVSVLVQGIDENGRVVISRTESGQIRPGELVTLQGGAGTTQTVFSKITGIQKDVTMGTVRFYDDNGNLFHHMDPGEQTAWYRRYVLDLKRVPVKDNVSVVLLVKLDFVPVQTDLDYCIIQNAEAIIAEAQAIYFGSLHSPEAVRAALIKHQEAIQFLIGQKNHYLGRNKVEITLGMPDIDVVI